MTLIQAVKQTEGKIYVSDEKGGGWVFVGSREEFLKYKPLKPFRSQQVAVVEPMRDGVAYRVPGRQFGKFKRYFDRGDFCKQNGIPYEREQVEYNKNACVDLVSAIYARAHDDLIPELMTGGKSVQRFLLSGAYHTTEEMGRYIIQKTKKDLVRAEEQILEFYNSEEAMTVLPANIDNKCIQAMARKYNMLTSYVISNGTTRVYKRGHYHNGTIEE